MGRFRERGLISLLTVKYSNLFKKDYKLMKKRGRNMKLLQEVVEILANNKALPVKYKDHILLGNFSGYRECHIQPDWLLIYKIDKNELILTAFRTGTHSDLY